jgi:hypothetical protein
MGFARAPPILQATSYPPHRTRHQVSYPGLQGGPDGTQAVLQDGPPDGGQ